MNSEVGDIISLDIYFYYYFIILYTILLFNEIKALSVQKKNIT